MTPPLTDGELHRLETEVAARAEFAALLNEDAPLLALIRRALAELKARRTLISVVMLEVGRWLLLLLVISGIVALNLHAAKHPLPRTSMVPPCYQIRGAVVSQRC